MHDRRAAAQRDVVAVEGDVEVAERHLEVMELGEQLPQPGGEHGAAGVDADEGELVGLPPFSTISCAMRVSTRRMSSPSRTTLLSGMCVLPGLSGPG